MKTAAPPPPPALLVLAALAALAGTAADPCPAEDWSLPAPPDEEDFRALHEASPFRRVLSIPETFALRGVAVLDDVQVATLYNRETQESFLVTREGGGDSGISLVEVVPAGELDGVVARVSVAGEEAELKYEETQLSPQPRPPSSRSRGEDGERRRGPSPQDRERYQNLTEEQRGQLREYIGHVMRSYPDISHEERGNMIRGAMIRLTDGRELNFERREESSSSGSGAAGTRAAPQGQSTRSGSSRGSFRRSEGGRGESGRGGGSRPR